MLDPLASPCFCCQNPDHLTVLAYSSHNQLTEEQGLQDSKILSTFHTSVNDYLQFITTTIWVEKNVRSSSSVFNYVVISAKKYSLYPSWFHFSKGHFQIHPSAPPRFRHTVNLPKQETLHDLSLVDQNFQILSNERIIVNISYLNLNFKKVRLHFHLLLSMNSFNNHSVGFPSALTSSTKHLLN